MMKLRTLLIGLATAAFSALTLAQTPIVIKFSHVVAADTPKGCLLYTSDAADE